MWSVGSNKRLLVYLGKSMVGWRLTSNVTEWSFIRFNNAGIGAALDLLAKESGLRKGAVTVYLSGAYSRPFLLPRIDKIGSHREVHQVAMAMCNDLTGLRGACQVCIEPRLGVSQDLLAVATEESTLSALKGFTQSHGWHLHSVQPAWTDALAAANRGEDGERIAWFACLDSDALTVLAGDRRSYSLAMNKQHLPNSFELNQIRCRAIQVRGLNAINAAVVRLYSKPAGLAMLKSSDCPWEWAIEDCS